LIIFDPPVLGRPRKLVNFGQAFISLECADPETASHPTLGSRASQEVVRHKFAFSKRHREDAHVLEIIPGSC